MNDLQDKQSKVREQIKGIDHLTLPVRDLDIAERFYTTVLDAKVEYRTERFIAITIGNSPSIDLFLQPWGQPATNQPNPHLAFAVRGEDLLSLKQRLTDNHIPVAGPIRFGLGGHGSLYFNDPSGNHLEFCSRDFTGEVNLEPFNLEKLSYQWEG